MRAKKGSPVSVQPSSSRSSLRAYFLEHVWVKYPMWNEKQVPKTNLGRVLQVDPELKLIQVQLHRENALQPIQVPCGFLIESEVSLTKTARFDQPLEAIRASDILVEGDFVGFSQQSDQTPLWTLFSPRLRKPNLAQNSRALRQWDRYLSATRTFFKARGFLEATTPIAVASPGTEPYLDPVAVDLNFNFNTARKYLITSPEYSLKKLIAYGESQIFEISRSFRNAEVGPLHLNEFHMLEWYRAPGCLDQIKQDVADLLQSLALDINRSQPVQLMELTAAEAVFKATGQQIQSSFQQPDYRALCARLNVHTQDTDSVSDLYNRIWIDRVEPWLLANHPDQPVLISQFPPFLAALSKLNPEGWASRFEVYWRGFEICNAYEELNDPIENARRLKSELELRRQSGKSTFPVDEDLIEALYLGFPPAGGIALGLERLFLALTDQSRIADVWVSPRASLL